MIAVQGPRRSGTRAAAGSPRLGRDEVLPRRWKPKSPVSRRIVSRTGYTGEDGCELIVPANAGDAIWEQLLDAGQGRGVAPAGLGARDTLRLEAAMPLYGHELSEEINPLEAGLAFAVNLENRMFPGRDALAKIKQSPLSRVRIGWNSPASACRAKIIRSCTSSAGARTQVGEITSGTFSPDVRQSRSPWATFAPTWQPARSWSSIFAARPSRRVVKLPFYLYRRKIEVKHDRKIARRVLGSPGIYAWDTHRNQFVVAPLGAKAGELKAP